MRWRTMSLKGQIFNFLKSSKERQEVSALRRSRAARFCARSTCYKSSDEQLPQTEQQYSMVGLAIQFYKSNMWFGDRYVLALLINSSLELNFFMHLKSWSDHVRKESKFTPSNFSQCDCSTVLPPILTFRYSSVPSSQWQMVKSNEEWYHQHTNEWRLMSCQRKCIYIK